MARFWYQSILAKYLIRPTNQLLEKLASRADVRKALQLLPPPQRPFSTTTTTTASAATTTTTTTTVTTTPDEWQSYAAAFRYYFSDVSSSRSSSSITSNDSDGGGSSRGGGNFPIMGLHVRGGDACFDRNRPSCSSSGSRTLLWSLQELRNLSSKIRSSSGGSVRGGGDSSSVSGDGSGGKTSSIHAIPITNTNSSSSSGGGGGGSSSSSSSGGGGGSSSSSGLLLFSTDSLEVLKSISVASYQLRSLLPPQVLMLNVPLDKYVATTKDLHERDDIDYDVVQVEALLLLGLLAQSDVLVGGLYGNIPRIAAVLAFSDNRRFFHISAYDSVRWCPFVTCDAGRVDASMCSSGGSGSSSGNGGGGGGSSDDDTATMAASDGSSGSGGRDNGSSGGGTAWVEMVALQPEKYESSSSGSPIFFEHEKDFDEATTNTAFSPMRPWLQLLRSSIKRTTNTTTPPSCPQLHRVASQLPMLW